MGMSITLRTNSHVSHFRRNLLKLIRLPSTDRLLLCSGYISEGNYYSILDDELFRAIVHGCNEVTTIAGMFSNYLGSWEQRYDTFVERLRQSGLAIKSFKIKGGNWHAKIALKLNGDKPIAGLLGSSNLTGPAYRENRGRFNHEVDILIWENTPSTNKYFRMDMIEKNDMNPLGPIDAILNQDIKQPDENERLMAIYKIIIEQTHLK